MMKRVDTFWLDITLRHDSCDPNEITNALGLIPFFAPKAGEEVGTLSRKSTVWMAHFVEGTGDQEWVEGLERLLALIKDKQKYLSEFKQSDGEVEVSINQAVEMQDGVLFKLQLDSRVLRVCGECGISLRVQAWSSETE